MCIRDRIYGPGKINNQDSVYQPAVRFTTRPNVGNIDIFKHIFANDTVNPISSKITGGKCIFETETILLDNNADGYIELKFNGKDSSGSEQPFAAMRIRLLTEADGATDKNTGAIEFVDSAGNAITSEKDYTFMMNNLDKKGGQTGCLLYTSRCV